MDLLLGAHPGFGLLLDELGSLGFGLAVLLRPQLVEIVL